MSCIFCGNKNNLITGDSEIIGWGISSKNTYDICHDICQGNMELYEKLYEDNNYMICEKCKNEYKIMYIQLL